MGFSHNISPEYIEELYRLWLESPDRVDARWCDFFEGFALGREDRSCPEPGMALKQSGVQSLIHRYRDIGHLLACTDPLSPCKIDHPLLSLANFGLEPGPGLFHPKVLQEGCPAPGDRPGDAGDLLPVHRRRIHADPGPG